MRLKYIKPNKMNYKGGQLRQGNIIEVESLGNLPENWFEVLEEEEPEKTVKRKTKPKKEEVIEDGDSEEPYEDLVS